jgi:hypothetical protein
MRAIACAEFTVEFAVLADRHYCGHITLCDRFGRRPCSKTQRAALGLLVARGFNRGNVCIDCRLAFDIDFNRTL